MSRSRDSSLPPRRRFGTLPADWAPTLRNRWFADSAPVKLRACCFSTTAIPAALTTASRSASFDRNCQRLPLSDEDDEALASRHAGLDQVLLQHRVVLSRQRDHHGWVFRTFALVDRGGIGEDQFVEFDTDHAIIVDVEATTAIRQAEVLAAKRMVEREKPHTGLAASASRCSYSEDPVERMENVRLER